MKNPLLLIGCALSIPMTSCSVTDAIKPSADSHPVSYQPQVDDHGRYLGCSWYCGSPSITVSATSTLSDGIYSYDASNVHDRKKDTGWAEGASGLGLGERLTFHFDRRGEESPDDPDYEFGIDSVSIINGFARSPELWKANGRIKTLKVLSNGQEIGTVELRDTIEPVTYQLPKIVFAAQKLHDVSFEITEIYPGDTYEDTAVSDFAFDGFGVH